MTWKTITGISATVIFIFVVGFLLGRSSITPDAPKTKVVETTIHDTTYAPAPPPIIIRDTTYAERNNSSITAMTSGTKHGVNYDAQVTISEIDKVQEKYQADWEVNLYLPPERLIKDITQRDSLIEKTVTKYIKPPFFLNEWFYVSLVEGVIVVLFTVKALFGL